MNGLVRSVLLSTPQLSEILLCHSLFPSQHVSYPCDSPETRQCLVLQASAWEQFVYIDTYIICLHVELRGFEGDISHPKKKGLDQ